MDDPQAHLRRGFNWLGGAAVIVKIIDMATQVAVLLFLGKRQIGIAALVLAISTVVEAFDGMGAREALVQARTVSRAQLDTLFWFITGAALVTGLLVLLAAPWIGSVYGVAGMTVYFIAIAAKQPIVGASLIPLAMMSRDLQYERLAMVSVGATLGAALVRLGLAVAGAGVWALVLGFVASGVFTLIGVQIARPFRPRIRFRMGEIAPLVRFGTRAAAWNFLDQSFNNLHFLLVGWLYGPTELALYRVAYTVAMEPALAVGTLINRTALPVFARASRHPAQLVRSLQWSLHRLAVLVVPLVAASMLAAGPITALIHDRHGHSYAAAAWPLVWLAAAALLRVTAQTIYPVVIGTGHPGVAARLSAIMLLVLGAGLIAAAALVVPARTGLVVVAAVWVTVYPPLLFWESRYLRRHWHIGAGALAQAFLAPSIGALGLIVCAAAADRVIGRGEPGLRLAVILIVAALTYAGLVAHARRRAIVEPIESPSQPTEPDAP